MEREHRGCAHCAAIRFGIKETALCVDAIFTM